MVAALTPATRALVVEDPNRAVAVAIESSGSTVTRWDRRLTTVPDGAESEPRSWPPQGPFDLVAVRLPRSKDELDMTLRAAVGVMTQDGILLLYGANDEGIRSIQSRLAPLFEELRTAARGGHCRVLLGRLPVVGPDPRRTLDAWRTTFDPGLPELPAEWCGYPGVFSHGSLDPGSELLISTLPADQTGVQVLDYGAGTGLVGGVCAARGATVAFLDVDTVALEALKLNVPGATTVLGSSLEAVRGESYDLIVSNPPIHRGKAESHDVLDALVRSAPDYLVRRGALVLVVQRRLRIEPVFEANFPLVTRVADDPVFKVLKGQVR